MDSFLNALGVSTEKSSLLKALYETPKKDKGLNQVHFQQIEPGIAQQADLLYLPNDDEYKYMH